MKIHWWKLPLLCPYCECAAQIIDLITSSDGEIVVNLICVRCNKDLHWKSNFTLLISQCFKQDYDLTLCDQKTAEIKLLSASPEFIKQEERKKDHSFLHELGINDEDTET